MVLSLAVSTSLRDYVKKCPRFLGYPFSPRSASFSLKGVSTKRSVLEKVGKDEKDTGMNAYTHKWELMNVKQIKPTRPRAQRVKMSNTNMAKSSPFPSNNEKGFQRKYTLVYLTTPFSFWHWDLALLLRATVFRGGINVGLHQGNEALNFSHTPDTNTPCSWVQWAVRAPNKLKMLLLPPSQ